MLKKIATMAGRVLGLVSAEKKQRYVWMKRATLAIVLLLCLWALVSPASLSARLFDAAALLPAWFIELLAAMFAVVWL